MELYTYYQSSASYRVRIALNVKGITLTQHYVDLVKGEQGASSYAVINPQMLVPSLIVGGDILTQSLALMEYLEETHPTPALLPRDPIVRAHARAIAHVIASDIAPIGNLKVRKYLTAAMSASESDVKEKWMPHWIREGFTAIESILATSKWTGTFCVGDTPTIADCCLMPQLYNARRWGVDLAPFPTITRIAAACDAHPAFIAAHPSNQPDAKA